MWLLSVVFGMLIGLSLGLTGGGGALFAVPLLVYGIGLLPRDAVGVSLVAVGATSAVGFVQRWRAHLVEAPTGLLFATAGMAGAPLGALLAGHVAPAALLLMFAGLMLLIAVRMWRMAGTPAIDLPVVQPDDAHGPACRRDGEGRLRLTSRCAALLAVVGLATGVLSGLFGVGGGFVIVPALVFFSGMTIQRAVGTSLLVITLVSASGTVSHLVAGRRLPLDTIALFTAGGVVGLMAGTALSRRLAGAALQRVFAAAIVAVALFVVISALIS